MSCLLCMKVLYQNIKGLVLFSLLFKNYNFYFSLFIYLLTFLLCLFQFNKELPTTTQIRETSRTSLCSEIGEEFHSSGQLVRHFTHFWDTIQGSNWINQLHRIHWIHSIHWVHSFSEFQ